MIPVYQRIAIEDELYRLQWRVREQWTCGCDNGEKGKTNRHMNAVSGWKELEGKVLAKPRTMVRTATLNASLRTQATRVE
jgi:hypothetical protein